MSNENGIEISDVEEPKAPLSIGEALSSARATRGVTVEAVASALKLHDEYIIALEEENFSLLPAAPYGRVYLKTYAEYLGLDSHPLLMLFDGKKASPLQDDRESRDTIQIKIQEEKPKNHWAFGVLVVIFVAAFVLLVQKQEPEISASTVGDDSTEVMAETYDTLSEEVPILEGEKIDTLEDSLSTTDSVALDVTAWNLDIKITKDSTWVHIVEDGKTVKNGIVTAPNVIHLQVNDSVNMKFGKIQNVSVTRSGKAVPLAGYNMRAIKVTEEKIQVIPNRVWTKNFES